MRLPGLAQGLSQDLVPHCWGINQQRPLFQPPEEFSTRDIVEPSSSLCQDSLCQGRSKSSDHEWGCFSHKMIYFSYLIKESFPSGVALPPNPICHYFLATWEWICCLRKRRCGSLWWQPSVSNYGLAESQQQGSDKNQQIYQRRLLNIYLIFATSGNQSHESGS